MSACMLFDRPISSATDVYFLLPAPAMRPIESRKPHARRVSVPAVVCVSETCAPIPPDCRDEMTVDRPPEDDAPDWLDLEVHRTLTIPKSAAERVHRRMERK